MRRFLAGLSVLCTLCAALIIVGRVVGSAQSGPLDILFTQPDGSPCERPCLLGIKPGSTTYKQAQILLTQHPATRTLERVPLRDGVSLRGPDLRVDLTLEIGGGLLFVVVLLPGPDSPCSAGMGHLVDAFGPPPVLFLSPSTHKAELLYPDEHLYLTISTRDNRRLQPGDHLDALAFFTREKPTGLSNSGRWQGFSSTTRYRAGR